MHNQHIHTLKSYMRLLNIVTAVVPWSWIDVFQAFISQFPNCGLINQHYFVVPFKFSIPYLHWIWWCCSVYVYRVWAAGTIGLIMLCYWKAGQKSADVRQPFILCILLFVFVHDLQLTVALFTHKNWPSSSNVFKKKTELTCKVENAWIPCDYTICVGV